MGKMKSISIDIENGKKRVVDVSKHKGFKREGYDGTYVLVGVNDDTYRPEAGGMLDRVKGDHCILVDGRAPHKPASSGLISVLHADNGATGEYYPSVYNLKWKRLPFGKADGIYKVEVNRFCDHFHEFLVEARDDGEAREKALAAAMNHVWGDDMQYEALTARRLVMVVMPTGGGHED